MIDRCNTDISFGKNCQMTTLLVLSGVTKLDQLRRYEEARDPQLVPDFYTESVGDIMDLLGE